MAWKKLGQGKRGLLYIIMIAVALLIALGGSQPANEYEGFEDVYKDYMEQVEDLNKSTENLNKLGKELDQAVAKARPGFRFKKYSGDFNK